MLRSPGHTRRLAASIAVVALSFVVVRCPHAAVVVPAGFRDEILLTGLDQPNGFAFLPDGRVLFTEQATGNVRLVLSTFALAPTPAFTVPGVVHDDTERGLQGIAVDPRWPSPAYVYVLYTHADEHEWLLRLTATGDLTDPSSTNLALGDPRVLIDDIRDAYSNHNGGTLRFGPGGYLYASLGEDASPCSSQEPDSLLGKVLRLDVSHVPAGPGGPVPRALLIPPGNPLSGPDSNASLVWAMGLRNPWRMHLDPETGIVYVADVGEDLEEEVDEIVPGGNYGWPFREGSLLHEDPECTEPGGPGGSSYGAPIVTLSHDEDGYHAIETASVYRPVPGGAANWPPEYWGNLFLGDYYLSRMRRLVRSGATWTYADSVAGQPNRLEWSGGMFWAVDFAVGPDGSLYWLKAWDDSFRPSSGMIRRIRYLGATTAVGPARDAGPARATPNPFTREVELASAFAPGARVRVTVYDATGRRVRSGLARESESGRYAWTWDGRDPSGGPAPPGLYLARLESGAATRTVRILRVR
jgi:glucose/arabinose dehydrogenase